MADYEDSDDNFEERAHSWRHYPTTPNYHERTDNFGSTAHRDEMAPFNYSYREADVSLAESARIRSDDGFPDPSPLPIESKVPLSCLSFIDWYPKGDATLTYEGSNGVESIRELDPDIIGARCSLLAAAFEPARGGLRLHLETVTAASAEPFLRYLYTGTYALPDPQGQYDNDVPTSMLAHCELYRQGIIYELEDLMSQAYVNVLRQGEYGCSSPDKPIELIAAISYAYRHLSHHTNVIDAIINYCVSCFMQHRLVEDHDFIALVNELPRFHQDLCRNCLGRDDDVETASAIMRLSSTPQSTIASGGSSVRRPTAFVETSAKAIDDLVGRFEKRTLRQNGGQMRSGSSVLALHLSKSGTRKTVSFAKEPVRLEVCVDGPSDAEWEIVQPAVGAKSADEATLPFRGQVTSAERNALSPPQGASTDVADGMSDSDWSIV